MPKKRSRRPPSEDDCPLLDMLLEDWELPEQSVDEPLVPADRDLTPLPPYRDGTTHIVLEPLALMARLAALVPPPRMHLTRCHAVFAPHSRLQAAITPAGRGAGAKGAKPDAEAPAVPKHVAMSWAQRLKRVFAIIEEPEVIARILAPRERGCGAAEPDSRRSPRGRHRGRAGCCEADARERRPRPRLRILIQTCAPEAAAGRG